MNIYKDDKNGELYSPPFFVLSYFKLPLSSNPDRPTILHISATYKKVGI